MGCGSSREASDAQPAARSSPARDVRHAQYGVTSQTAINTSIGVSRGLAPPSQSSFHHSSISRSIASTPRHSTARDGSTLAEHFNIPLKLPKSWISKDRTWTSAQLERERYEFFETRVTGRKEVWAALRQVAESVREGDAPTAQTILDAVGVTLPTGRLEEGGYDEAGNLYKLPKVLLSNPANVISSEHEDDQTSLVEPAGLEKETAVEAADVPTIVTQRDKGKTVVDKDSMKVKCRLSDRGGPDLVVLVNRSQNVGILSRRIRDEAEVSSLTGVRIAYLGRILEEKQTLAEQGWKEGHVVNVLVTGGFAS